MITANNVGIFDCLKVKHSLDEIAGMLGIDKRAAEILLDALTGLGLLNKSGGKYRNAPVANTFLVKGAPYYQGDMIRHADSLWKSWSGLDEVVRTGAPNRGSRNHEAFIKAMHNNAVFRSPQVIGALDLRGVRTALDLGGGPGTYSMELAKRKVQVTLFDLPDAITIAREVIGGAGIKNISYREGDFLSDDIGRGYDLVFISQVFHSYSIEENKSILAKCREALNPRGRVAVQEFSIEKNRAFPPRSALFSVNMLVNTLAGRCYAAHEMKQWLTTAEFRNIRQKNLDDTVLLSGMKG